MHFKYKNRQKLCSVLQFARSSTFDISDRCAKWGKGIEKFGGIFLFTPFFYATLLLPTILFSTYGPRSPNAYPFCAVASRRFFSLPTNPLPPFFFHLPALKPFLCVAYELEAFRFCQLLGSKG